MTKEEIIKSRLEEIKKEIEVIDKKIKNEAKKLMDIVNPKSLDKIAEYKSQREKLTHAQYELFIIMGTSIK